MREPRLLSESGAVIRSVRRGSVRRDRPRRPERGYESIPSGFWPNFPDDDERVHDLLNAYIDATGAVRMDWEADRRAGKFRSGGPGRSIRWVRPSRRRSDRTTIEACGSKPSSRGMTARRSAGLLRVIAGAVITVSP